MRIDLTNEEIELILNRRKAQEAAKQQHLFNQHVIKTMAEYYEWLCKNARGSSFSTFLDEFGYGNNNAGFDAAKVFYCVDSLIKDVTKTLSSGLGSIYD